MLRTLTSSEPTSKISSSNNVGYPGVLTRFKCVTMPVTATESILSPNATLESFTVILKFFCKSFLYVDRPAIEIVSAFLKL